MYATHVKDIREDQPRPASPPPPPLLVKKATDTAMWLVGLFEKLLRSPRGTQISGRDHMNESTVYALQ